MLNDIIQYFFSNLDGTKWNSCLNRTPHSISCIDCFKRQYFDGNSISYECEEKRKIYVTRYLPAHMAENIVGFYNINQNILDIWRQNNIVRILSIGGGPGSDLCSFLDFMESDNIDIEIEMTKLDIQPLWDSISSDILGSFSDNLNANFRIIHGNALERLSDFPTGYFDVVCCSYLISEISQADFETLGATLRPLLTSNGVLVINDRPEDQVQENIKLVYQGAEISNKIFHNTSWAGFTYPYAIASVVQPKLNMSSMVSVGSVS